MRMHRSPCTVLEGYLAYVNHMPTYCKARQDERECSLIIAESFTYLIHVEIRLRGNGGTHPHIGDLAVHKVNVEGPGIERKC